MIVTDNDTINKNNARITGTMNAKRKRRKKQTRRNPDCRLRRCWSGNVAKTSKTNMSDGCNWQGGSWPKIWGVRLFGCTDGVSNCKMHEPLPPVRARSSDSVSVCLGFVRFYCYFYVYFYYYVFFSYLFICFFFLWFGIGGVFSLHGDVID